MEKNRHHIYMMMAKTLPLRRLLLSLPFVYCLFTGDACTAQDYNYINYDVKDGLAGSTVYAMCQDKDGFMWFATEAGVSRFDGTQFKNFSTADGLPETEVLSLFADSSGRVWMAPFKSTVCYYYKGKIYNQQNDSLLKRINLTRVVYAFAEDRQDSSIVLATGQKFFVIKMNTGEIKEIDYFLSTALVRFGPNPFGKGLICVTNNELLTLSQGKLGLFSKILAPPGTYVSEIFRDGTVKFIKHPTVALLVENIISPANTIKISFVNSTTGSWMVDSVKSDRYSQVFLSGKNITHTLRDSENNLWFSTFGGGVYKLTSQEFKTYHFENSQSSEIFSIEKLGENLLAGSGSLNLNEINGSKVRTYDLKKYINAVPPVLTLNRILCIKKIAPSSAIIGIDGLILRYDGNPGRMRYTQQGVKSIDEIDQDNLLVGTSLYACIIDSRTLVLKKMLWKNRTTAVSYYNNKYYLGTVDGLYIADQKGHIKHAGENFTPLRYRVSYFTKSADGKLWVATYGGGLVCLEGDRVVNHISTRQGLSSNICRTLYLHDNFLWVGTNKGLNKIDIANAAAPIVKYTTADGLPSDIINAIYIDSGRIYVGSPSGLTYFNENNVSRFSRCDLRILELSFNNQPKAVDSHHEVKYHENSLKISFAGISFKSGGDISYRYRLRGLTNNWDSTRQNVLEYVSLPAGSYELQLQAINKFGVHSRPVSIRFTIITPFWQTLWFKIGLVIMVIGLTWLLVARRYRLIRRREQEKTALSHKLNDLEQMALRAQMNPHFIFNCLNSIQNFIINNNLEATNQYLTEFANLIRQTLDNSEKGAITISNEIKYLTRYLEMEKMRFGNSFDYSIETDYRLDTENIKIPTMMLQPYVENCIRHGIRHKKEGIGLVQIKFLRNRSDLLCIVEDNGIGREKSLEHKSRRHVEYQSKGMSLTADRISILNRQHAMPITIEVTDLKDPGDQPTGTRVTITIPGNLLTKLR